MMDSVCMDTYENTNMTSNSNTARATDTSNSELPAWRMPISTTFSSSLRERLANARSASPERNVVNHNSNQICPAELQMNGGHTSEGLRENQKNNNYDNSLNNNSNMEKNEFASNEDRPAVSRKNSANLSGKEEEDSQAVIQILLPCIVCNRTFSPEALERHAKVCTKVNTESPYKPKRGTFDISEKRKKGTKLEAFIPPPPTFDALTDNRFGFSRGSRSRTSLRGTSCTTRSTLNPAPTPTTPTSHRRERSMSQSRERSVSISRTAPQLAPPPPPSSSANSQNEYPYDDTSEFGSNNSEELNNSQAPLPSYAKPIAPTDICPYCTRKFGIKSYDRHVEFCKELYERKRYEIQPMPKEKEEAMERQEIRTKYRPMKSSSSCSSLRSMSPGKDFASMAMKLFGGLRRTEGSTNLYFNQIKNNLKKSNESIANSCYGDYTRGLRRPSPSPARSSITTSAAAAANKLNNLLTKSYLHQQQQQQQHQQHLQHQQAFNQYGYGLQHPHHQHQQGSLLPMPMRVNTSSNIPKMTKSTDSLNSSGHGYSHVSSSGYGQPPSIMMSNNFARNSRSRSSLHKNFFRTKRAEPDGTENTSLSQSPTATSPLIITPANFYTKGIKSSSSALDLSGLHNHKSIGKGGGGGGGQSGMEMMMENARPTGTSLLSSDPDYDPYEKAAKQLEELLKTSPVKSTKRSTRRAGLEKAFESVGVPSDMPGKSMLGRAQSLDYNSEAFGRSHTTLGLGSLGVGRRGIGNGGGGGGGGSGAGKGGGGLSMDPFGLGGGLPMMMTPNIDDSYWDQILRKGDNQHGNNSNSNNNQECASSQEESDTTSGASDTAKSRAMSNTSSADSAFSRSEVNDPEFEALESIVTLGDLPSATTLSRYGSTNKRSYQNPNNTNNSAQSHEDQQQQRSKSIDLFSSPIKSLESQHRSVPRSASVDHGRIPMEISTPSHRMTPERQQQQQQQQQQQLKNNSDHQSSGGGGGGTWAKFCHECGTSYPTVLAKFCPECGEKRVCKS